MFGRDELIFEAVCFPLRQLQDGADARRIEYLSNAPTINRDLRAVAQLFVNPLFHTADVNIETFQKLRHNTVILFDEGQEKVLSIYLRVVVALHNFIGTRSGILSTLGKSVKSHYFPSKYAVLCTDLFLLFTLFSYGILPGHPTRSSMPVLAIR